MIRGQENRAPATELAAGHELRELIESPQKTRNIEREPKNPRGLPVCEACFRPIEPGRSVRVWWSDGMIVPPAGKDAVAETRYVVLAYLGKDCWKHNHHLAGYEIPDGEGE